MTIHEQVKNEIKKAMLEKDEMRLSVLRGLLAAFTNELVAQKRKPQEMLSDEDAVAVVKRSAKQRKESIEQFIKGGRVDLAKTEEAELLYLQKYIPAGMSMDEIKKIVLAKKEEMGAINPSAQTDKSKIGQLVGAIMKELKGKADGADVKKAVEEIFN